MSDANFDYWELKFWEAYGYYPNFLRKEGGIRAMKLGEAINLAKPDLFELSEARKDLLCKRILDSSTETLTYFSNQIESELQDREMRDFGDERELRMR